MAREKDAVPKPSKIRERKLPLTRGFQCLPRVRKRTLLGATRGGMATERVHAELSGFALIQDENILAAGDAMR